MTSRGRSKDEKNLRQWLEVSMDDTEDRALFRPGHEDLETVRGHRNHVFPLRRERAVALINAK